MGLAWSQRVGSIALVAMAACSAACSGGGSQPGETTDSTGGRIAAASSAGPLQFGVVGSPIDLSANVSEAILPGGTIFQDSAPLFGTSPDPKQSAELLHLSSAGVNPSSRSTVSGAFASSLAESDGNGGVGASQVIFGPPGGTDEMGKFSHTVLQVLFWMDGSRLLERVLPSEETFRFPGELAVAIVAPFGKRITIPCPLCDGLDEFAGGSSGSTATDP